MAAGIVEAEGDQVLHAQLAHVAERHRRGGRVLCFGAIAVEPIFRAGLRTVSRSSLWFKVRQLHPLGPFLDVLDHLRLRLSRSDDPRVEVGFGKPLFGLRLLRHL